MMMKLKREMNNQYLLNSTVVYANNIQTGTYTLNKISKRRKNSKIILVYEFSAILSIIIIYYYFSVQNFCLFISILVYECMICLNIQSYKLIVYSFKNENYFKENIVN